MSEVRKDLFIGVGFLMAAMVLVSFAIAVQVQAREGEDDSISSDTSFGLKVRGDGTVDDSQPGIGAAVQAQAQVQNRGEETQVQAQVQAQEQTNMPDSAPGQVNKENKKIGQDKAAEHRSAVANFVQSLLQVADSKPGGIGEQVRNIAQQQNQSAEVMIQAMEKVQTRSKIRTFLFGSDYKNLGTLRSEMVKTRNRLEQLNRLIVNIDNEADKIELQNQIQNLIQEQESIDNFIKVQEIKISLFGWIKKLFSN